ncbi:transcriptional regulator, LysR family [Caballeronia arationis]|uniref:Transcriptional regulator, LysR family n=1 Tax=Caballeronia arationis TaxID=1777142 RepID=A0A7Z7N087_9BURK|nr:LysR family transcriptional regulator [Caballeronia arationis]SOE46785.1 transcriptional regulator, LysR family [Caballeronia arationis]
MRGDNFRDIVAFLAVARERSFTRAAAQLGVSQSALSHTIRSLETRLGLRLLTRTTRSVAPTEAGERLIRNVAPRFEVISDELAAFHEHRDKPMGTVRITTSDFAANTVLWPKLSELQPRYPDIKIDIIVNAGLTDIVEERYDAGVRFGDQIAKNMAAVPISPDIRMSIVGTPSYLSKHSPLKLPAGLSEHSCINTRFSSRAGVYAWELSKGKRKVQIRVDGAWTFNSTYLVLDAALSGAGLAYVPEQLAIPHLASGRLVSVLKDWCPTFPGLHIYYTSRQVSPALSLIVETLRHRR